MPSALPGGGRSSGVFLGARSCCDSDNSCDSPSYVPVPGPAGADGADGADGAAGTNAYTTLTAQFTVPAVGANVTIAVGSSAWMAPGQIIFIQNAGYYRFISSSASTNAVMQNLGYAGNAAEGATVAASNKVSPGGASGGDLGGWVFLPPATVPTTPPGAGIGLAWNAAGDMWRYDPGGGWVKFASA